MIVVRPRGFVLAGQHTTNLPTQHVSRLASSWNCTAARPFAVKGKPEAIHHQHARNAVRIERRAPELSGVGRPDRARPRLAEGARPSQGDKTLGTRRCLRGQPCNLASAKRIRLVRTTTDETREANKWGGRFARRKSSTSPYSDNAVGELIFVQAYIDCQPR